jgi:hypothetical protein
MCKKDREAKRRMSGVRVEESAEKQRSFSFDKPSSELIPKEEWQRMRRKNTMLS